MKFLIRTLWLSVLFVWTSPITCQVLPFEILGQKDGIPQSQVSALAQDHEGYLWVGTFSWRTACTAPAFRSS
jgi:ligand-binding sensor domain-containing protein